MLRIGLGYYGHCRMNEMGKGLDTEEYMSKLEISIKLSKVNQRKKNGF